MHRLRDPHSLMAFLTVAEEGSIGRAARLLNTSQPSLTRLIKELERSIRGPVFRRSAAGVRLTALGERLLHHAHAIRAEVLRAERNMEAFLRSGERHFALGLAPVHPLLPASRALVDVALAHPDLRLNVIVRPPSELSVLLREGAIEMVIGPLGRADDRAALIHDVISYDSMAIYCAAGHPLTRRKRVSARALHGFSWVLGPPGSLLREQVEQLFAREGLDLPRIAIEAEDVALRRSAVLQSELISVFQEHHVHNELQAGVLMPIGYRFPSERQAIGVIRLLPHSPESSLIVGAFRAAYREAGMRMPSEAKADK